MISALRVYLRFSCFFNLFLVMPAHVVVVTYAEILAVYFCLITPY